MSDRDLDQLFRSRLTQPDSSDINEHWEAVKPKIVGDRRNRPLLIWWIGAGMAASILVAMIAGPLLWSPQTTSVSQEDIPVAMMDGGGQEASISRKGQDITKTVAVPSAESTYADKSLRPSSSHHPNPDGQQTKPSDHKDQSTGALDQVIASSLSIRQTVSEVPASEDLLLGPASQRLSNGTRTEAYQPEGDGPSEIPILTNMDDQWAPALDSEQDTPMKSGIYASSQTEVSSRSDEGDISRTDTSIDDHKVEHSHTTLYYASTLDILPLDILMPDVEVYQSRLKMSTCCQETSHTTQWSLTAGGQLPTVGYLGLGVRQPLSNSWSVAIYPSIRYAEGRDITSNKYADLEVQGLGFGELTSTHQMYRATALYIPLMLQYQLRRHHLLAGMSIEQVLQYKDTYQVEVRETFQDNGGGDPQGAPLIDTPDLNTERIDGQFNKVQGPLWRLELGYGYDISNRWSLGLTGSYLVSRYKPMGTNITDRIVAPLYVQDHWHIGLRVSYGL